MLFWLLTLILAACNMENKSSEYGLYPDDFYGKIATIVGLQGVVGGKNPFKVHSCCDQRPPQNTNDGPAEWAVDGITSHWWHSSYVPHPEGYSLDTRTNGHVGDAANFIMKGSGTCYDGYTWTKDTSKALGGTADPVPVADVVPAGGSHWITLDVGKEIEIGKDITGIIGYYRRADQDTGGLGAANTSYEVYVSKWDFGWIVDEEPGIIRLPGITRSGNSGAIKTDNLIDNTGGAYEYIYLKPDRKIKFRFVQIRWRFTTSATARNATAANIIFRTMGEKLSYDYLTAVYIRGKQLLSNMNQGNRDYYLLRVALENAEKDGFPEPKPDEIDNVHKLFTRQRAINVLADNILTVIYKIDPPKKPPEVIL